jgi:hypothetical protein
MEAELRALAAAAAAPGEDARLRERVASARAQLDGIENAFHTLGVELHRTRSPATVEHHLASLHRALDP